jgi:hypothetical protein
MPSQQEEEQSILVKLSTSNKCHLIDGKFYYLEKDVREAITSLTESHKVEMEKARKNEQERILSNILKWSTTATVVETTGREGASKATKKLREKNLAGSYHVLYQEVKARSLTLRLSNKIYG